MLVPVVISLLVAALGLDGATEAAHARVLPDGAPYTMTRAWAGFVAPSEGSAFADVRATWVVPRIVCNRPSSSVAFWVGLGGATARSRALEQIGTSVDCSDRAVPSYSAWYEAYPATAVDTTFGVRAGDSVTAEVRVTGVRIAMSLVNDSTGARFAEQLTAASPETDSAEWIVEAPAGCFGPTCAPLPFARFGRVTFVSATATATLDGRTYALGDPRLETELVAFARGGRIAARPLLPAPRRAAGSVLG